MNFRKVLPLAVSAALMFSFSACNKNGQTANISDSLKIVGTVGEEKITAQELKFYLNMDKEQAESQAGLADKSVEEKKEYWKKEESAAKKKELIDSTLSNLTELKILIIKAKKDNVKLEAEDLNTIDQSIEQLIQSEGNGDKDAANKAMMEKYGVEIDDYRVMFEEYILAYNKYASGETTKIEISDSDIQKVFESNKEQYNKVTVKHVLVSTVDSATQAPLPEDKVAEKKLLADDVLKKAQAGEDFEALVKQYSEDPGSKDAGGEYTFGKGEMVAEFEEWSFKAKEGEIGLVQTSYGFHIIKFISKATTLGDEDKAAIKQQLQSEQYKKKIADMKAEYELIRDQKVIDSVELF
jgi:foldase protein PrsA